MKTTTVKSKVVKIKSKIQDTKLQLGSFECVSGKLIVSDPCYDRPTIGQAVMTKCKKGTWNSFANKGIIHSPDWGNRVKSLTAVHEDYTNKQLNWNLSDVGIGVDSGQAGVFEERFYKNDSITSGVIRKCKEAICEDEPWYSLCCDRTLHVDSAGTIPYGVVSSSGTGDGCYRCFIAIEDGLVIGINIVF